MVLFSSHQMNYIEEFCNGIAVLNSGKIVLNGQISEIKRSYPRDKIAVSSSDADKILPVLIREMGGKVVSAEKSKDAENTLSIQLKEAAFKGELLQKLSSQGFDIDDFRVCEPSLNDIFVQYTEAGI